MKTNRGFAIMAPVLALLSAGAAFAQEAIGPEGRAIAVKLCSDCHDIEAKPSAAKGEAAPAFRDIANMPSATVLSLKVFLKTPHAKMPNLILDERQIDDVVGYIAKLKE